MSSAALCRLPHRLAAWGSSTTLLSPGFISSQALGGDGEALAHLLILREHETLHNLRLR